MTLRPEESSMKNSRSNPSAPLIRSTPIPRRTLLRGALGAFGASIALPPLEALLNPHGDAYADGHELPTPFGLWFWGNGVRPELWVPQGEGPAWVASEELAPLEAHRAQLSVISGCTIHTGTHAHHAGMTGVMTGAPLYQVGVTRDTIVSTFAGPSLDVLAAQAFEGQAPFRSLELGVCRFRGTDEGTTFQHLSHNGPNNPNPAEYNPRQLFERLFSAPLSAQLNSARRSVLDLVRGQVSRLQPRLGAADRIRLDQHLSSIRAVELRLSDFEGSCARPESPLTPSDINGQEQIELQNELMSELLATALSCDLTRVFSILFSTCGAGTVYWQAGASDGLHLITHDEPLTGSPATQATVHQATIFKMRQLSRFLDALKSRQVGDGTLLDRCSILCTTEHADGRTHSYEDFPLLIAGLGGGRLRGGLHYRSSSRESVTKAGLTALRAAGVELPSFGVGAGQTSESIEALWS